MMISDENKKSFSEMFKGRAVYYALCACVLAAGIVSYTALGRKNPTLKPDTATVKPPETSTYVHINERVLPEETTLPPAPAEVTLPPAPVTEPAGTEAPAAEAVFDNAAAPVDETEAPAAQLTFSLPLNAKMGKDFSMGVPVFSATMKDYRTHNGVDFTAQPGEPVHPIAAGKVTGVKNDPLYGNTVTVDHGGGIVSVISGLAPEGLIHEGADVYNETALGVVGELPVEAADGSHIHLEVRVNGVLQDPLQVMGYAEEAE